MSEYTRGYGRGIEAMEMTIIADNEAEITRLRALLKEAERVIEPLIGPCSYDGNDIIVRCYSHSDAMVRMKSARALHEKLKGLEG